MASVRARQHVYLVPGFFGFANLGELVYFTHVREYLEEACRREGMEVAIHPVRTLPTSSLRRRARRLLETIAETATDDAPIHLVGHSSGGLDVRLLTTPNVALGDDAATEPFASRVKTVVTVASPHHGTPVASFFSSILGQKLLQLLSLSTIYTLRLGRVPIGVLIRLGGILARLDDRVALNSVLLDQLFDQLLSDFTEDRRRSIKQFFSDVGTDQALLPQLLPEQLDLFNASTGDRPGVRYGCVVARSRPPGVRSLLSNGLDPSAHATFTLYYSLYRLAARTPANQTPPVTEPQLRRLEAAYGALPSRRDNDGVVPTLSQVWGEIIHAAAGDHLDVIGHFSCREHVPPHFDWICTNTHFDRPAFESLWTSIARYLAAA
jgi:triacylglycerol lipase